MDRLAEPAVRASFVNCSKGEAKRINVPRDLAERPWEELDFLGWRDPGAPDRRYLVAESAGGPVGVVLRASQGVHRAGAKATVCSLCLTSHTGTGVALLAAPRTGAAGRQGNTVGVYLCADLDCSLYVRGKKETGVGVSYRETIGVEERIERLRGNLRGFLAKVGVG